MADKAGNKIRNVGPKSAAWLRQVGIKSPADLQQIGAVEAFLKIKRAGFKPSLNLLYALAGALENCHWSRLPQERKSALLFAVDSSLTTSPLKTSRQAYGQTKQLASPVEESLKTEETP